MCTKLHFEVETAKFVIHNDECAQFTLNERPSFVLLVIELMIVVIVVEEHITQLFIGAERGEGNQRQKEEM